jgi:hypothetical protein
MSLAPYIVYCVNQVSTPMHSHLGECLFMHLGTPYSGFLLICIHNPCYLVALPNFVYYLLLPT